MTEILLLDRELLVEFRKEDKLEKIESMNLSSTRVSNGVIPPFPKALSARIAVSSFEQLTRRWMSLCLFYAGSDNLCLRCY